MKIFKQIVFILIVSFVCGLGFNAFSPHGINILDNPWSNHADKKSDFHVKYDSSLEQEEPVVFVNLDRARQFVENHEGIVLDARTPEDYAEGHIPGAYLLSFYHINDYYPDLKDQLTESQVILVYCGNVNCEDSEFLANELFNSGHDKILVYKGGFQEWKSNKLPVKKGES